ncbi:MAG: phenylalanine--tRNA ligase subunit beta, partial [Gammaproteobacteria bacterium]|nr:phenylalanine--tRNA ligase subunit beta [Gammaproteobacteria bacterium]
MKVPYTWLQDCLEVPWPAAEVGSRLTMAGFELEALGTAAPPFSGVVVAEILSCEPHGRAENLRVCRVLSGAGTPPLQIVCGASNARTGLKSALAQVGAVLPGDVRIGVATLRGVESQGMLASAKELALGESPQGILELPADAPVGLALREYLNLDEAVLEFNVTPNRGDAMSVLGIAREVASLAGTRITGPRVTPVHPSHDDRFPVRLDAPAACPRFAGCIVRGVDNRAAVPLWMRERLRRAGLRSISPVVDVTNYVMLELGQPMHAYDLTQLRGGIVVRFAGNAEPLTLLDGRALRATRDMLLITDAEGAVGLGGVMGGARTAVSVDTTEVFFEAAFFSPDAIRGCARAHGLQTDASQR